MKFKVIILFLSLFLFSNPCFDSGNVFAEHDNLWTFEFSELSISDSLSKISLDSGIEINLDGEPSVTSITKSYKHYTLDELIMDMFIDQSYVALFNYNEHSLISINIWVMPRDVMNRNQTISNTALNKQSNNSKTFNDQGQIQKIEHTPNLSRSIKENKQGRINESVHNKHKSKTSIPVRQSSSSINKSGVLIPDIQDRLSDHEEIIGADDNLDNDSPPDKKQFRGLEPPPMPPGMIPAEE